MFVNLDIELLKINNFDIKSQDSSYKAEFILNYLIYEEQKNKSFIFELIDACDTKLPTDIYLEIKLIKKSVFFQHNISSINSRKNTLILRDFKEGSLFEWCVVKSDMIRMLQNISPLTDGLPKIIKLLTPDFVELINSLKLFSDNTKYLVERFNYMLKSFKKEIVFEKENFKFKELLSEERNYLIKIEN